VSKIHALLLAAGEGRRLKPLSDNWPKCLMPVGGRALLEYWLDILKSASVCQVTVNLHHHANHVKQFLNRPRFSGWVHTIYERRLLGTAGTLFANRDFFEESTALVIHADNWCHCDFDDFIDFHQVRRPRHCQITMMTFDSPTPETCGIVETDAEGVVQALHEKVTNPPGSRANAAVYLLEPEVLKWLELNRQATDFSNDVLPHFIGRIATWHNNGIHRDIGVPAMLKLAQLDPMPEGYWRDKDDWQLAFERHPIHVQIHDLKCM